jgi:outer membrane protein TolC
MTRALVSAAVFVSVIAVSTPAIKAQSAGGTAPMLTLDAAIDRARQHNRPLVAERMEVDKAAQRLAAFRTQKKPLFDVRVTSGSLLFPMNFQFPVGSFGVFPTTGPIPPADTVVASNPKLNAVVFANMTQPLTQLRRLGQGEKGVALGRDVAAEQARAREIETIANVRSLYYGIIQAEAGLLAREESIRLLRELDRVTEQYEKEQVVLPGELLTVRAGLQQQEHELLALRNAATGYREKLNAVLARSVDEAFAVQMLPAAEVEDVGLPRSEERALDQRPEIRLRRLQAAQAAFDLRATATPGMPDVSVSVAYTGFWGFQVLPHHGALAGILGTWEPWDWGRRKAEREEKRLTHQQALIAVTEAEALVRVDVRARHRAVREAFDRLRVCESASGAARERLRVATERLKREAALDRDLIEAQARVAQADFDCQQALAAYWTARAELERARADQ